MRVSIMRPMFRLAYPGPIKLFLRPVKRLLETRRARLGTALLPLDDTSQTYLCLTPSGDSMHATYCLLE